MIAFLTALDVPLLQYLYSIRDPNLVQILIWFDTMTVGWLMVVGVTVVAAGLLARAGEWAYATSLVATVGSCGVLVVLLKGLVARARPDSYYQAYHEVWYSFPSADAALAAALYGFLAYTVWKSTWPLIIKSFFIVLLVAIIAIDAFSRLYFGVHYFSDVVGGLLLGFACVWFGAALKKRLSNSQS